jgi:hypothetical protein
MGFQVIVRERSVSAARSAVNSRCVMTTALQRIDDAKPWRSWNGAAALR